MIDHREPGRARPGFRFIAALVAAVVGVSAAAAPAPPPEFGLRGILRVELAYSPSSRDHLADDPECQAIGPALRAFGINLVQRCRPDDVACGRLMASVDAAPVNGSSDRTYVVELELLQPLKLARDPGVALTAGATWSEHRFGRVRADQSMSKTSCAAVHDLAASFSTLWKAANP